MSDQPKKVCTNCGGVGKVRVNDDTWKSCWCSFARMFKSRVGPEIWAARKVLTSPLYAPRTDTTPAVDLTKESVWITGREHDVRAHVRFALMAKHLEYDLHYYSRWVTDEQLKACYLGEMSYKSKKAKDRDMEGVVSYNTLGDYIGPDLHLVIVQLGVLGHPNRALPGLVKEALLIRQAAMKPTWIFDTPEKPFEPGHLAYSDDLCEYIGRFKRLDLTELKPGQVVQRQPYVMPVESEEGMVLDEDDDDETEEPIQRPVRKTAPEKPMNAHEKRNFLKDNDLGFMGDDDFKKKPRGGKGGGKGGGGPL